MLDGVDGASGWLEAGLEAWVQISLGRSVRACGSAVPYPILSCPILALLCPRRKMTIERTSLEGI